MAWTIRNVVMRVRNWTTNESQEGFIDATIGSKWRCLDHRHPLWGSQYVLRKSQDTASGQGSQESDILASQDLQSRVAFEGSNDCWSGTLEARSLQEKREQALKYNEQRSDCCIDPRRLGTRLGLSYR